MLTRLRMNGFKNLVDFDVSFGPFTCIAGANGVGKSNVFDAIRFLSALAEKPTIIEAAQAVRGSSLSVRDLFHKVGKGYADTMTFDVEMLVPKAASKEEWFFSPRSLFNPASTLLRYELSLHWDSNDPRHPIRMESERLTVAEPSKDQLQSRLGFPIDAEWASQALWQDDSFHKPLDFILATKSSVELFENTEPLPTQFGQRIVGPSHTFFTLLSSVTPRDNQTAQAAQDEMLSWRVFALDPTAIRLPVKIEGNTGRMADNGENLLGLLARIRGMYRDDDALYSAIINRMFQLGEQIRSVQFIGEYGTPYLRLLVTQRDGTTVELAMLSDGTLRFLALAILSLDTFDSGVYCIEEPENGIHPARIPGVLTLLRAAAVDTSVSSMNDNPPRNVIISTHAPALVQQVNADDLLVGLPTARMHEGHRYTAFQLLPLSETWRTRADSTQQAADFGRLFSYLNPTSELPPLADLLSDRVIDRADGPSPRQRKPGVSA